MLAQSDTFAVQASAARSMRGSIAAILTRLVDEASVALDDDREAARVLLRRAAVLLRSSDLQPSAPAARRAFQPALMAWQMRRVTDHIEGHLDTSLPLCELAAIAQLSTSYFSRAFKGACGQTPHAFILSRRIARARQEMLNGEESLAQIALACGFADQAHLARTFRRAAGLAPGAWRRLNRLSDSPAAGEGRLGGPHGLRGQAFVLSGIDGDAS